MSIALHANPDIDDSPSRRTDARLPKTIIVVNDAAHVTGGAGKVALSSAVGLARAGFEVQVFAAKGPIGLELANEPGIRVTCLGQDDILSDPSRVRAATRGIWNFAAQQEFERLLRTCDPATTVVHVHGWVKALSSSVIRVATELGFPLVITLHDYFIACPTGGFYRHRSQAICKIQPMSLGCVVENCDPRNYAQKLWRVARQAVQQTAGIPSGKLRHVITISDLSSDVVSSYLDPNTALHRVYNPIDVDSTEPADVSSSNVFLYVGRLSAEKGAQLFAQAAREAGVRAVFVGDGDCADEVRRINPDALVTGWLTHEEVKQYIGSARAVIVPSLWYESGPLVVLEAAARGVPAIVANTCAAREDLVEGITGVTFRSGEQSDLILQLKRLMDPDFAQALGTASFRRYWSAPRSLNRHVARLITVYQEMLRDAGQGAI